MKKWLVLSVLVMFLCGCTKITGDLQSRINEKLAGVQEIPAARPDYNKPYYAYYVEPSVGRIASNEVSNLFMYDNVRFVMNLNVSGIINRKYYEDVVPEMSGNIPEDAVIASSVGEYRDFEDQVHEYSLRICKLNDQNFVFLRTGYMDFYSVTDQVNVIPDICGKMLQIAKSVKVNQDVILSAYSKKESIAYEGKTVKLFEDISPENGMIEELFVSGNSAGNSYANGFAEFVEEGQEYHGRIETDEEFEDSEIQDENSTDDNG